MAANPMLIFESIIRDMEEGILVSGIDGVIILGNAAVREQLGLTGEIEGKSLVQVFLESSGDQYDELIDTIMAGISEDKPKTVNLQYTLNTIPRKYMVTTYSVRHEGERTGVVTVIRDVTEISDLRSTVREIEEDLNATLEKVRLLAAADSTMTIFDSVIQVMEDGILVTGLDGRILVGNKSVRRQLGLPQMIEGKTLAKVFLESSGDRYDAFIDAIMDAIYDEDGKTVTLDYCLDGKNKRYMVSTFSVRERGRRIGVAAVIRDVTEVTDLRETVAQIEEDLQASIQQAKRLSNANSTRVLFENVIRDMTEGILVVGMDGRIVIGNQAVRNQLGLTGDIDGKTLARIFLESSGDLYDGFIDCIMAAIYDGEPQNATLDYELDGEMKKYFVTTFFVREDRKRSGVVAVIHDVTEVMELRDAVSAMEEIRRLNTSLQKRNDFIRKIFGRYLSDDVVESILSSENGARIGGIKRKVTMMFTDLRGSTSLSEELDAADFLRMLNHFLEAMIDVINEHHGTILEFEGDSIVSVFGAPRESKTAAVDAVSCAVAMQNRMSEVNYWNRVNGFPEIQMGVGIHTGNAILGNIGSRTRTKYDVIGRNMNLASRIEAQTRGGQILISDAAFQEACAQTLIVTGSSRTVRLKGIRDEILIHEVLGCGAALLDEQREAFTPRTFSI